MSEANDSGRERIIHDAAITRGWAERGTGIWSAVHNGGTLLALICSTVSTFILAVNPPTVLGIQTHVLIAIVSAIAALAVGIPKYLNAEQKWRTNRRSRSEARLLERYLADATFATRDAREWLTTIEREHERGIVGKDVEQPSIR